MSDRWHFIQVLKREVEDKRPLVEANLDTGRSYMREDSLEEKRVSMDSGEGTCNFKKF